MPPSGPHMQKEPFFALLRIVAYSALAKEKEWEMGILRKKVKKREPNQYLKYEISYPSWMGAFHIG